VDRVRKELSAQGVELAESLFSRYGAEAQEIHEIQEQEKGAVARAPQDPTEDPEGFPLLEGQLRHAIRTSMVLHLTDFYFRRAPLYSSRADHGRPWVDFLSRVWAQERGLGAHESQLEKERLLTEIDKRSSWLRLAQESRSASEKPSQASPGSGQAGGAQASSSAVP